MAKKTPTPPPPEPHYHLRRWMDDWNWFFDTHGLPPDQGTPTASPEVLTAYFSEKYPDHASHFQTRFAAAIEYKRAHIDPMPPGEEKLLVTGDPLMAALYRLYSKSPDDMLAEPYPIEFVISLAKEHKPRH